jgi:hypothetical protein
MAVTAGNMSRLQGMLLVVVVALLAALFQFPAAAAGTRYTVSWNYPYSRTSFANWNKGTSYVVGDSIRKFRPLQSTPTYLSFFMQSQTVSACCFSASYNIAVDQQLETVLVISVMCGYV